MEKAMKRFMEYSNNNPESDNCLKPSETDRAAAMEDLKKLKALLDLGAITKEEYQEKKKEYLDRI